MKVWFENNKKWLWAPFVLVLLISFAWQAFKGATVQPVRIGVLHSLTGTMAQSEAPLVDAIRLAVEEINESGGVRGQPVEIVVEDCRSDAAYCAQRAEKLIVQDKVQALFGCWTSDCRKAVKPVVEKHRHLLFYPVQYEGMEQSPDIVYTGATPNQQLIPMLTWAMQQQGRRAYLVGSDYVFPRTANRIANAVLRAHGGQALAESYVPMGAQDFVAVAAEIAALKPDFVLNTLNGDSNRYFFLALEQAGVAASEIPVFSTSIAEPELAAIGPQSVAGHYAAWGYFQSLDTPANKAFVERFRKRFGQDRLLDDPMEAAYVGVHLWGQAYNDADVSDIHDIKVQLEHGTLAAPSGILAVDAQTNHLWKPVRIGRARADGQFDIVWQSGRSLAPAPFPFFLPKTEQGGGER